MWALVLRRFVNVMIKPVTLREVKGSPATTLAKWIGELTSSLKPAQWALRSDELWRRRWVLLSGIQNQEWGSLYLNVGGLIFMHWDALCCTQNIADDRL
jgi:hypothetical protein